MKRYAMIQNGVVLNISAWDGVSLWNPGDEWTLVDLTEHPYVQNGWLYDGETFTEPPPEQP